MCCTPTIVFHEVICLHFTHAHVCVRTDRSESITSACGKAVTADCNPVRLALGATTKPKEPNLQDSNVIWINVIIFKAI